MQITDILLPTTSIYYQDRHYHTIEHVRKVINVTRTLNPIDEFSVEMAALFHDIIYVPGAENNEQKSASFASEYLSFYNHNPTKTAELIMATRHLGGETDYDAQVLCDADLFELGSDWNVYAHNNHNIRLEFKNTTQSDWVRGRIRFLENFLAREKIFYILRDREKQARENMQKELSNLTK